MRHALTAFVLTAALVPGWAIGGGPALMETSNAGNQCTGALPAFAGTLRTRPLAVVNEGNTGAFVTCAFVGGLAPSGYGRVVGLVQLRLINATAAQQTITCTMVSGIQLGATPAAEYVTKAVVVPAAGGEWIVFAAADLPSQNTLLTNPAVSCALPPGIGVSALLSRYSS